MPIDRITRPVGKRFARTNLSGAANNPTRRGVDTAEGRDIQESVRQKMEEEEAKRRAAAVREHVPPPKGVSLGETAGLSMEEKATKMFPAMADELRRRAGLAPYAVEPRSRSLDWWRK